MSVKQIIYREMNRTVTVDVDQTNTMIGIFIDSKLVAEFEIEIVWDMIIDAMSSITNTEKHSLLRRKKEALAGKAFTKITFMED